MCSDANQNKEIKLTDSVHHAAGSHDVIELHGSLHRVLCLDCQQRSERDAIQRLMETQNPYLA
ncbi:Sir2 family NAD-dependent protein deacetylase, partial [Klebsiella pneumoniae]|uniref:Sir2 family NAD-dependent protein deacetylase n=1 Tax=Klebsiella pneumoniae TaxID=573 RepID=UPI00272F2104